MHRTTEKINSFNIHKTTDIKKHHTWDCYLLELNPVLLFVASIISIKYNLVGFSNLSGKRIHNINIIFSHQLVNQSYKLYN